MGKVSDAIKQLKASKKTTSCAELRSLLIGLGFVLTKGTEGDHWIVKHPGLEQFFGSDFDCGAKNKGIVLVCYVQKILQVLKQRQVELEELLDEQSKSNGGADDKS